jgi:hypothetical protein
MTRCGRPSRAAARSLGNRRRPIIAGNGDPRRRGRRPCTEPLENRVSGLACGSVRCRSLVRRQADRHGCVVRISDPGSGGDPGKPRPQRADSGHEAGQPRGESGHHRRNGGVTGRARPGRVVSRSGFSCHQRQSRVPVVCRCQARDSSQRRARTGSYPSTRPSRLAPNRPWSGLSV